MSVADGVVDEIHEYLHDASAIAYNELRHVIADVGGHLHEVQWGEGEGRGRGGGGVYTPDA